MFAIIGRGLHRAVDRVRAPRGRSDAARRRLRARARRVRCVGPQRWLVLGDLRGRSRANGSHSWSRRRHRDAACDVRDARRDRTRRREGGHRLRLGARWHPRCRDVSCAARARLHETSPTIVRAVSAKTTTACSRPTRRAPHRMRTEPRCAVHPALRGDPSREARARPRRRGRTSRRAIYERTGGRDHQGPRAYRTGTCAPTSSSVRPRRSADAARPAARDRADLLPDDRDRAAPGRVLGRGRARRTRDVHRRSPLVIYGQRTADGRFAFGGRGTPYHLGSRVRPQYDVDRGVFGSLHARCGACSRRSATPRSRIVGAARSPSRAIWYPSVGFDRATGIGWAGGYVGDGVSTTNLAGRTIADLVLGRDTDLVRLPWVGHVSPRWEPEPLRWLGVNVARVLVTSIDRAEARPRTRAAAPSSPPVSSAADEVSRSSASAGARVRAVRRSALRAGARSSAWSARGTVGADRVDDHRRDVVGSWP